MEERKCKSGIQNDSWQTWDDAWVETADTSGFHDVLGGTREIQITTVDTLHFGLNNIYWIIEHNWAESRPATCQKIYNDFIFKEWGQTLLCVSENDETNTLVCWLFKESWDDALIQTTGTVFSRYPVNPLEDVLVLGHILHFVVNQLGFNCFLGCDDS